MQHVYCCECGVETEVEAGRLSLGRVIQCPSCGEVRAHVYPAGGGRAWILVRQEDVKFYRLLDQPKMEKRDDTGQHDRGSNRPAQDYVG